MSQSIDTSTIETGLRSGKEQAEAEERRMERLLARFDTTPKKVRDWIAPISNEPLTLPPELGSPPQSSPSGPPSPNRDTPPPTPEGTERPPPTPIVRLGISTLAEPIAKQGKKEGYGKAEEFGALLKDTEELCPAVAQHLAEIMNKKQIVMKGFPRKPFEQSLTFLFTDKVSAPMFDGATARIALPIHKKDSDPKEPADPLDLVDGLIFETCNMEMVQTFDSLSKEKTKSMTPPPGEVAPKNPVSLTKYGRDKSDGEAKSTIKDCELKLEMLKSGAPLAKQGKRNIASLFATLMAQRGSPLADLDDIIESDDELDKLLAGRKDDIVECFAMLKDGRIPLETVCGLMARTAHKKTAKEDETGCLPTEEMYGYEEVEEQQPKQTLFAMMGDLKGAGIAPDKLKILSPKLQALIAKFDLPGDPKNPDANCKVARIKYLAKIQAVLTEKTGITKFPCLNFSPAMVALADKRVESAKRKNPDHWGVKDDVSAFETQAQAALDEFARELEELFDA